MSFIKRLSILIFVSALPLLLSQCGKGQGVQKPVPLKLPKGPTYTQDFASENFKPQREPEGLSPERQEFLGNLLLQNRDYENSLVNYIKILQKQPNRHDLRYKVGVIFLLSGQFEPARRELARVLVERPEFLEAHEALGLVHLEEKQYALALEEFRLVLEKDRNRPKTRHLMGIAYLAASKPREAARELEAAAALDSRQVSTLVALGEAYLQMKDYPKALLWLKQGEALDPHHQKLNNQLGMALAGLKRYPEALQAFLKGGDEAQAYNNIGVHYFLEGRYEEAAKCFQRAIELRPTFYQEAKVNLQRALEKLQQAH